MVYHALFIISYSKISVLFLHFTSLTCNLFPTSHTVTRNEFGHTVWETQEECKTCNQQCDVSMQFLETKNEDNDTEYHLPWKWVPFIRHMLPCHHHPNYFRQVKYPPSRKYLHACEVAACALATLQEWKIQVNAIQYAKCVTAGQKHNLGN